MADGDIAKLEKKAKIKGEFFLLFLLLSIGLVFVTATYSTEVYDEEKEEDLGFWDKTTYSIRKTYRRYFLGETEKTESKRK